MPLQAIKWENGKLEVLDQMLLPTITRYIPVKGVEDGWHVINNLHVRGAPAIALVACLSLVKEIQRETYTEKKYFRQDIEGKLNYLMSARPAVASVRTAAEELITLANNLTKDHTVTVSTMKERFVHAVVTMLRKDVADNRAIGDYGAQEILRVVPRDNFIRILTHSNTGSLATAEYGTALSVIRSLHTRHKLDHVYCTETRPHMQGARLSTYGLVYDNLPGTLVCDDVATALLKRKQISAIVVGAVKIAANGDTANKIGTYQIALLALYHNVPFYVAASRRCIDFSAPTGRRITVVGRPSSETAYAKDQTTATANARDLYSAFDVTPAQLITGIITEMGVYRPADLLNLKARKTFQSLLCADVFCQPLPANMYRPRNTANSVNGR